jgi:hypothetical protein
MTPRIANASRELGLPRTRFHDLRHAHATQLLSAGLHVKAVNERLGHASTSFTMDTYSAVIPSMDERPPTLPISCSAARERLRDHLVLVLEYDVAGMARLDRVQRDWCRRAP